MTNYHVNPETGRANICQAVVKCRFGLPLDKHCGTKEQARAGYEKSMKASEIPPVQKRTETAPPAPKKPLTKAELRALREQRASEWLAALKRGEYPKGPRKVTYVSTKAELDEEASAFESEYSYSPEEMLSMRYVTPYEVKQNETEGRPSITVKIPSYSEAQISTDLARRTLGMEPRPASEWDSSPYRKLEIVHAAASKETFGMFETNESYTSAREHFKKIDELYREAKALCGDNFRFQWR